MDAVSVDEQPGCKPCVIGPGEGFDSGSRRVAFVVRSRLDLEGLASLLEAMAGGVRGRRFSVISGERDVLVFPGPIVYLRLEVTRRSGMGRERTRIRLSMEWKTLPLERSGLRIDSAFRGARN